MLIARILHIFKQKSLITPALAVIIFVVLAGFFYVPAQAGNQRVITIYDGSKTQTVTTDASSIAEVLERAKVTVGSKDLIEPALETPLISPTYSVNIYRARPVTIVDGNLRKQVVTPYQSGRSIIKNAEIPLYDEDEVKTERIENFVTDGAFGLKVSIDRATPLTLVLYGTPTPIRTQARTVEALLQEKKITLGPQDGMSLTLDIPITENMILDVWRNGAQTKTEEQPVAFETERIQSADREVGYREVKEPGQPGKKIVTYQIELRNGKEVARKEIQSVVVGQPKKQVEVIGVKPRSGNALSKAKGVVHSVDSKGVVHRETYYDLPMNVVMGACGGTYSIRADGAKVDQNGYILVAANLQRYPRCSVVETSLGLGKVYDTGGFARVHPDGFDLATDWSNYDGR
ncbi:MAG TPA: ubiquitin-like domain-containing protein [Candidatus Saccharimonadales bacterium]